MAIHGWLGNASTFDRLIPLLSNDLSILAIDLPGYGKSSHLPPGCYYHRLSNVVVLRRIVTHFKWEKLSLLGHALGGSIAFLYSSCYPETVKSLSIINAPMTPIPTDEGQYFEAGGALIDKFIERDHNEAQSEKTAFTKEELLKISAAQFDFTLPKESIEKLLERDGSCNSDEKCYFTYDRRLQDSRLSGWNNAEILEMAEELKTNVLVVMYDESPYYMRKEDFYNTWEIVRKKALSASMHIVQGGRHDLLDNPEGSSEILNRHLSKYHLGSKETDSK